MENVIDINNSTVAEIPTEEANAEESNAETPSASVFGENILPSKAQSSEPLSEAEQEARRKLDLICEACDETKAQNILALDVRRLTPIADYFMICSGTSATHIQSIAENVQDKLRMEGKVRAKPQGNADSFWIILDYSDVILHVFDETTREFYDLERLWSDAPQVVCGDAARAAQSANIEIQDQSVSETVDKDEANPSK